jgi:L-asparagine transporter-like permease
MNGTVPHPLRFVLWILGGVLAVMAVLTLLNAWRSQTDGWWISVCFFVSAAVCITIAAVSGRSSSGSASS